MVGHARFIDDVSAREERERQAYAALAQRTSVLDDDLVLPRQTLDQLLRCGSTPLTSLEQMFFWARPLEGARVLEICCNTGEFGAILAAGGAHVTSIDLCPELIEVARRRIQLNRLADRMTAEVMSAHKLELPDDHFDLVFGKASLHHLDLELARGEIRRVLRPGGWAIFSEPICLSPALSTLRGLVPISPDAESPDERQLGLDDLARFTGAFAEAEYVYFRLTERLNRLHRSLCHPLSRWDRWLLDRIPALSRYAGVCAFRVRK